MTKDGATMLTAVGLSERVYDRVRTMLVTLEIKPGTRIGIESLARTLGVSQTPVREALSRLEAGGLTVRITNVGFCAAPALSHKQIKDLFEVRLQLDPFAARRAAEHISKPEIEELQSVCEQFDVIAESGKALCYRDLIALDISFNKLVASASGNTFIIDTLDRIQAHFHLLVGLFDAEIPRHVAEEMRAIFDAISVRDGDAAERTMRHHITKSIRRFSKIIAI